MLETTVKTPTSLEPLTMLSIAIPLYNKMPFIEKTIQSCIHTCNLYSIEHEVVIVNNSSTDASADELDSLTSKYQNCKIFHLPYTISLPDNWLFALNNCQGAYLKLLLADDLMPVYDPSKAIDLIKNSSADYVIGMTEPVFQAKGFETNYFKNVNIFRKRINPALSVKEKAAMVSEAIASSCNPFGDIGALMFHRNCLSSLNLGVRTGLPAFTTFPDLDIYLTLFANHHGSYLDETVSFYVYNETSPAVQRGSNPESNLNGLYAQYEANMPMHFITAFQLRSLAEQLTEEQKYLYLCKVQEHARRLLGYSDTTDADFNQNNIKPHHMIGQWGPRGIIERFAKYIARSVQMVRHRMP
jgi:glycosyltransferase involved in cell wall biosynthesis